MQNRYLSVFVGQNYILNGYKDMHRVVDLDTGQFITDNMPADSSLQVAEGMNARLGYETIKEKNDAA